MNKIKNQNVPEKCEPASGCCSPSIEYSRRDFVKISALGAGFFAIPLSACKMISQSKRGHLIPEDKMLSPEWIESLTKRGLPEIYTSLKDELKYIGMPVGGICCGQLYISGDGRLWLWDIFQSNYRREGPAESGNPDMENPWRLDQFSMGGLYQKPRSSSEENNIHKVKSGFSIRLHQNGETKTLSLDSKGFEDISFRGEYPIAKISYKGGELPITVNLRAYSPYIPLNVKESGIPATILSYELTNTSEEEITADIGGCLENRVCPEITDSKGKRNNTIVRDDKRTTVFMTASGDGLSSRKGFGSMAISVLGEDQPAAARVNETDFLSGIFENHGNQSISGKMNDSLVGGVATSIALKPGESSSINFLVSWYFPDYKEQPTDGSQMGAITDLGNLKRHYANNFSDANDVAAYVADHFERLSETTLEWNRTWYDSTLPHWLLDRSFISMDCLASQTSHLFDNGRFWGWEGVDCCPGTCTHVWQYAQGMARIFPSLERDLRSRVDYGISYDNGLISYRAENGKRFAIDGQLGTIIRVYREHKMAADNSFLNKIWPRVKQSMQYIIDQDIDADGLLEGEQPHTLDAAWFGPMGWISGMYLAALKACEQMAVEMGDAAFAGTCNSIIPGGKKQFIKKLFNGEYFIHLAPDFDSINTNDGCHIDQVLGQSFAHQVNLPEVLPQKETRKALESIWKYNFAPDAGQYALNHKAIKGERIYAMPGESGLLMTTWPLGGDEKAVPGMADRPDDTEHWIGPGGYFDECMNGFEYQAASHMVWEGMLIEGLSIMKAVHERYNGAKRNPYDEVECSSHYSRSMASYGTFIAACGFSYHGPKGEIGFAPKINPEDFKSAFTSAEAWGSYQQKINGRSMNSELNILYGNLDIKNVSLEVKAKTRQVTVKKNSEEIKSSFKQNRTNKISILIDRLSLKSGDKLEIEINLP